jgi:hypothetical protein
MYVRRPSADGTRLAQSYIGRCHKRDGAFGLRSVTGEFLPHPFVREFADERPVCATIVEGRLRQRPDRTAAHPLELVGVGPLGDGGALATVERDPEDADATPPQRLDGQGRVVQRAEPRPGDDQRRQRQVGDEVDDFPAGVVRQRHPEPTGALEDTDLGGVERRAALLE